ncbi:CcmD family protein [Fulvivirga ligni]|uniref:CcmD family protein n=1 Tax=Fulvivirga ligni TaxID=2904246 RepID=UPI001F2568D8|nr:CcmD family protein [Fulvivirga ligni]UII22635.1 CcmD family protein [Fulvivirga ligni]
MKKIFSILLFILCSLSMQAQDKIKVTEEDYNNTEVEMADQFREDGKIYVLTGVIVLILGGLVTYLVIIDRKVARIEKQLPNHNS